MFGFLKDKLKSWLGKSKEKVETKVKLAEPKTKKTKESKKKTEIKEKPAKQEKKKKTKAELKEERQITDKLVQDIKDEKTEFKTPEERFEDRQEEIKKQQELKKEKVELEIQELEKEEKVNEEQKEDKTEKKGFFAKLKGFFTYKITESDFLELFEDLERLLLENNVAFEVVDILKEKLKTELVGKEIKKGQVAEEIQNSLKDSIESILLEPQDPIKQIKDFRKENNEPYKILFFGINGAGKTTSIAKFCHILQKNKLSCVLVAADTFRAASIEQLELHGNKLGVKVIKHTYGSDPSAVAFDAIKYAKNNNIDVVLIDTAGRMHTKDNLLKEMEKICRVTQPNMKIFVAEAIAGNDATEQAKAFNEIAGIDASILSKTDVDEKGGTILSIGYVTNKPILYLGVGQNYDDLELFNKQKFIERLGL